MIIALNRSIKHNPTRNAERIAAQEREIEELACEMDEFMEYLNEQANITYIAKHLPMLREIDDGITDILIEGPAVVIETAGRVIYVDTSGMDRVQITCALIHAVRV